MAQWTVDPRQLNGQPDAQGRRLSDEVTSKALEAFAAAGVIVRTSRNGYRCRSWHKTLDDLTPAGRRDAYCTRCRSVHNGLWYHQVLTRAPDGWKVVCDCDSTIWCWHGFAVALVAEHEQRQQQPDFTIPVPVDRPRRRGTTDRVDVIPRSA